MGQLINGLTLMVCITAVLFMGQIAIVEINPTAARYFECRDSLMSTFDRDQCLSGNYSLNTEYAQDSTHYPAGNPTVSTTSGNIFTDTFNAMKNWILDSTGLSYLMKILTTPFFFLQMMGLDSAFVFALSFIWYSVMFFLFINWIKGGYD
jgi:hypothetical protein